VSQSRPVVYVTSGIFGYLYRWFPIGRRLAERGRRVVVVTASAEAVEHARAEGFEVVHLAAEAAALEAPAPVGWPPALSRLTRYVPGMSLGPRGAARRHWRARAAALLDTAELDGVLRDLDPVLVLTEAEEHRVIRAVLALERPLMLFEDLYGTRPDPDVPFGARSHRVPTGSGVSRVRAAVRWQRFFAVEAVRRRAERWWVGGADWHSALDELGRRAGLDRSAVSRRYLQFYDYLDVPRLRTVAPELAFPGESRPPLVTGPIVDVDRCVHGVDDTFADRWATVTDRRRDGSRLVYVSPGTFLAGQRSLLDQVITAAAGLDRVEVVVSAGAEAAALTREPLPANVTVFGRVPQLEVLADADAVVTTGGLNTIHEAVWFGVPILAIPVAGIDTPGNAARVHLHRVGRRVPPRRVSVPRLREEIRLLLDDQRYRDRSLAMGERLRAWNGIDRAVTAIDQAADAGGAGHRVSGGAPPPRRRSGPS
jgi:UDP:flavonoid glycosyltransferase YjiC (YdhE family)